MRNWIKKIYQAKISFMFYWNMGYGEFATPLDVILKIIAILAIAKVWLKIGFSGWINLFICSIGFFAPYLFGKIMVKSGMTQFANRLSNKYNPELDKINKIAEHLGVK